MQNFQVFLNYNFYSKISWKSVNLCKRIKALVYLDFSCILNNSTAVSCRCAVKKLNATAAPSWPREEIMQENSLQTRILNYKRKFICLSIICCSLSIICCIFQFTIDKLVWRQFEKSLSAIVTIITDKNIRLKIN